MNVVVEGIAASAASVIMCAGDTVTVYPGSLAVDVEDFPVVAHAHVGIVLVLQKIVGEALLQSLPAGEPRLLCHHAVLNRPQDRQQIKGRPIRRQNQKEVKTT